MRATLSSSSLNRRWCRPRRPVFGKVQGDVRIMSAMSLALAPLPTHAQLPQGLPMPEARVQGTVKFLSNARCGAFDAEAINVCPQMKISREGLASMDRFAGCIVRARADSARALLARDEAVPETLTEMQNLVKRSTGCIPSGTLAISPLLLLGQMAERLVLRDIGVSPLASAIQPSATRGDYVARNSGEYMAICTALRAPALVQALFASDAGSVQEAEALKSIVPVLPECLADGDSARINRRALRAIIALGTYRLVQHNAPAALAGKE